MRLQTSRTDRSTDGQMDGRKDERKGQREEKKCPDYLLNIENESLAQSLEGA